MVILSHVVQADFEFLIHLRMPLIFWCSIPQVLGLQMCATMPSSACSQTQAAFKLDKCSVINPMTPALSCLFGWLFGWLVCKTRFLCV